MPSYDAAQESIRFLRIAVRLLTEMQSMYNKGVRIRQALELYQAGTNQDFNDVIDSIFVLEERQELNQMLTPLAALIDDWETNHFDFLFSNPE